MKIGLYLMKLRHTKNGANFLGHSVVPLPLYLVCLVVSCAEF